jgi:hypothetical protein
LKTPQPGVEAGRRKSAAPLNVMTDRTTKISIAREQLEDGIALFLMKRYVSSLTLLGASEEIMARIIEGAVGKHPLEHSWELANVIRSKLGHPHISKQEIFRSYNAGRNAVKHHSPGQSLHLNHARFGEAFMMIQRATWCADHLKLRYKGKKEYRFWYVEAGWGNLWRRKRT